MEEEILSDHRAIVISVGDVVAPEFRPPMRRVTEGRVQIFREVLQGRLAAAECVDVKSLTEIMENISREIFPLKRDGCKGVYWCEEKLPVWLRSATLQGEDIPSFGEALCRGVQNCKGGGQL